MTPLIAGSVDVDFDALIIVGVVSIVLFLLLVCYGAARRISKGQLLILGCFYLAVVLLFLWFLSIRLPTLNAGFYLLQPHLSIGIALTAAPFVSKAFSNDTHE